ncbi:MAG: helix-turn-helix domain-containing protein [Nitrososphaerota archaeon]|jgi:predicted DNA binding protein|nr:helix-turn-helix domain-containing protein [Nitrososphaerota archaeon]MDG6917537.1 helix-turn-helix domain-containing protein [Nitrososphaerota archaeon]MDG6918751.1 helix-turn-helix domain-containing protein [Nitrososphaerota archaeon]MDG6946629.1 helix-turn-helix domain-containing protein [Nitrososphaerota archaeon]
MYELDLTFAHSCFYSDLSRRFSKAKFSLWPGLRTLFFEARTEDHSEWRRMNKEFDRLASLKGSRVLQKASNEGGYQVLMAAPAGGLRGSSIDMVTASDCLFIPPVILEAGKERYRIVAFDRGGAGRLLAKFRAQGKAEITHRAELSRGAAFQGAVPPFFDPFSKMTSLQLAALATSMAMGYYGSPRRISTGEIAAALGVPRTTFQQRRRSAEAKLMAALAPMILTRAEFAPFREKKPSKKPLD